MAQEKNTPSQICVIGNSHSAAFKLAWDRLGVNCRDYQLTFFASGSWWLQYLEFRDASLMTENEKVQRDIIYTSGGKTKIDLCGYDFFLLVGLKLSVPEIDRVEFDGCAHEICRRALEESLAIKIARMVRRGTSKPIYLAPNPQFAPDVESPTEASEGRASYSSVVGIMRQVLDIPNAELLEQPRETLQNNWDTRPEFLRNARTLDVGDHRGERPQRDNNRRHMNAEYGVIYLRTFLRDLARTAATYPGMVGEVGLEPTKA